MKEIEKLAERTWARNELSERERARQQELQRTVRNDARLLAPTKCEVRKMFCIGGQPVHVGAVVVLTRADADSLAALNKVTIET